MLLIIECSTVPKKIMLRSKFLLSTFIEEILKVYIISLLYTGMTLVTDPSQKFGFRHFVITD